jgi:hypothetical protein
MGSICGVVGVLRPGMLDNVLYSTHHLLIFLCNLSLVVGPSHLRRLDDGQDRQVFYSSEDWLPHLYLLQPTMESFGLVLSILFVG